MINATDFVFVQALDDAFEEIRLADDNQSLPNPFHPLLHPSDCAFTLAVVFNAVCTPHAFLCVTAACGTGMVSPFRLARACLAEGSVASKYLKEFLVWRELAHTLCFCEVDNLHTLQVLPRCALHCRWTMLYHSTAAGITVWPLACLLHTLLTTYTLPTTTHTLPTTHTLQQQHTPLPLVQVGT